MTIPLTSSVSSRLFPCFFKILIRSISALSLPSLFSATCLTALTAMSAKCSFATAMPLLDIELFHNRGAIVGNCHVSDGADQHLVHSSGSEGRADSLRNNFCGCYVISLSFLTCGSSGSFL